jgi:HEAT repeat protein
MPTLPRIPPGIDRLIQCLDDSNTESKRLKAAIRLGELKSIHAVDPLELCLSSHEPPALRAAAADALGKIGDPSAARSLVTALQERGFVEGIWALGSLGNPIAIRFLMGYFTDQNSWAFDDAHGAIFDIGVTAILPLIDALNDTNPDMRFGAVLTLGRIGHWYRDQRVVAPLIARWNDPNDEVRDTAINCLASLGEMAEEAVLKMLEGGDKRRDFAKTVMARMTD